MTPRPKRTDDGLCMIEVSWAEKGQEDLLDGLESTPRKWVRKGIGGNPALDGVEGRKSTGDESIARL